MGEERSLFPQDSHRESLRELRDELGNVSRWLESATQTLDALLGPKDSGAVLRRMAAILGRWNLVVVLREGDLKQRGAGKGSIRPRQGAGGWPKVQGLTPKRERALRARFNEGDDFNEDAIFTELERASQSWIDGFPGFCFDWVFCDPNRNYVTVAEGKYRSKPSGERPTMEPDSPTGDHFRDVISRLRARNEDAAAEAVVNLAQQHAKEPGIHLKAFEIACRAIEVRHEQAFAPRKGCLPVPRVSPWAV